MKSIGIVRRVDELGRIVLPIELRRDMGVQEKDALEIFVEGECIILKKHEEGCVICRSTKGLIEYKKHKICTDCVNVVREMK